VAHVRGLSVNSSSVVVGAISRHAVVNPKVLREFAYYCLITGAVAVGLASPAFSANFTDNYIGGIDNGGFGDVIGNTNPFGITSVDVTRPDANTLNITINTFYAGAPDNHNSGAPNTFGTGYGSLFLSTGTFGASPVGDTYSSHVGFWGYAVTVNDNGGNLTGGLYNTGSTSSDGANNYNATGVVQNYTTGNNGTIVMANVNGNPISAPTGGNPGDYFRQGQAVQYNPYANQSVVSGTSVLESIVAPNGGNPGQIVFTITDNGLFDGPLALAWAMTCANDVIIADIPVTVTTHQDTTPLPAALPLFCTGLGALGLLGWRRKRKAQATA
jgi:hypothetical protein